MPHLRSQTQALNVLSLFDGIACGAVAMDRADVPITQYFASEIDRYAISIAQKNHPWIVQLGDIKHVTNIIMPKWGFTIDLLMGGSPCQGFSFAGTKLNFDDPRSKLFFEFVRIKDEVQPRWFLLENVKMTKKNQDVITEHLGVEPILINSALLSAQNRERLYWTNIPNITQPEDKNILLSDVLFDDAVFVGASRGRYVIDGKRQDHKMKTAAGGGHIPSLLLLEKAIAYMNRKVKDGRTHWDFGHHSDINDLKSKAVVANFFKGVPYNVLKTNNLVRYLHPIECERLQTLPDNYTEGVSKTQRYKMIGNGWTVDVIAYILSHIPKEERWKKQY